MQLGVWGNLLTVQQAAEYLNVSVSTVRRLRAQGQLAFVKLGSSVRFTPDDLDDLVTQNHVKRSRD
ncbi:DNA-binding protein [Pseudoclavibacter sp. Z016]|nr:DNA-binding protein [Pseudoclavibacter sp. Z016]